MKFINYVTSYRVSWFYRPCWFYEIQTFLFCERLKYWLSETHKVWLSETLNCYLSYWQNCWNSYLLKYWISDYLIIVKSEIKTFSVYVILIIWISEFLHWGKRTLMGNGKGDRRLWWTDNEIALKSEERQRKPLLSRRKWLTLRERNDKTMLIFILYFLLLCAIIKGFGTVIVLVVRLAKLLMVVIGRIISLLISRKSFVRA